DSEPTTPGLVKFWNPYPYRSAFNASSPAEECERALAHLRNTVVAEGPHMVAAIILETVVGTNGILVPPDGYLQGVRDLCDEFGIIMICDEVMAGFGRCGEWFAVNKWGVTPDLITFAKGVNSGYVPLGGVIISPAIAATFDDRVYQGGLTYSGHPLACAAAVASINIFREEGIVEHARRLGNDILGPELAKIAERHPSVGEVRGLGVFWAIELVSDRTTKEPLSAAAMGELVAAIKAAGVWPFAAGNRIHVVPPLVIGDDDLRTGLAIIDEALAVADEHAS
ncbi:MAG TPA: aminotransferase class III-fold pyridoxal phosphate-dependent enzyme, partial [Ilumatobacteraceae bacterium]